MKTKNPIWKYVTPVPPEMNGHGYLWECRKCGNCIAYWREPMFPCPKCADKKAEEESDGKT